MSKKTLFQTLWRWAERAIATASKVVIIGYSMPETDMVAMKRICKALRANDSPELEVEIVLGPEGAHTTRLRTIVERAVAHRVPRPRELAASGVPAHLFRGLERVPPSTVVKVHAIYAQDYLTSAPGVRR